MAIISLASPVSGIRGKVGGNVFSANKAGPYLKAWSRGSNPRSFLQGTHRSTLIGFSTAWITLSAAEKLAWDVYADLPAQELTNSLGETYKVSGFNWYIGINLNRASFGDAFTKIAPVAGTPATPTVERVRGFTFAVGNLSNLLCVVGSAGLGERMVLKAEIVTSQGNVAGPKVTTFLKTVKLDIAVRTFTFKSDLLVRFGTPFIGQKLFATIQQQSPEGRRSIPVGDSGDIIS